MRDSSSPLSLISTLMIQLAKASSLTNSGASSRASLTATTVPETGESFFVVCEAVKKGKKEPARPSVYLFLIGEPPLAKEPVLRFVKEYRAVYGKEL